jgi:Holliday junction resolvase RusA-like endonuclease
MNKIRLDITPLTWVRVTQRDKIFFRIPRDKLRPAGLARLERIERYNDYKVTLLGLAKEKKFIIPAQGASVTFFIPCPKSWSQKKKTRYHGTLHQQRPDLKNLLSAWEDALCVEDKYIAHYSDLCKRWVDFPTGWVEISFREPAFEVVELPPSKG